MKNFLLLLTLILTVTFTRGQMSSKHTFYESATVAMLDTHGYVYYSMDVANSRCNIYNTDFSLWKSVNLTLPLGMYLYDLVYVSDHLFQADDKVEMAYISYTYDTVNLYYTYQLRVINEDGNILLDVPGGYYCEVLATGASESSFLVWVYDFSVWPYTVETRVYTLPGQSSSVPVHPGEIQEVKPYPNPAKDNISLPYSFRDDNFQNATIEVLDNSGRTLNTLKVNEKEGKMMLNTFSYPAGVYYYRLRSQGYSSDLNRFIVVH